jgi:hypothetical protein
LAVLRPRAVLVSLGGAWLRLRGDALKR